MKEKVLLVFLVVCLGVFLAQATNPQPYNATVKVPKAINARVWVHMMPWFETRATSDDNRWGIHWTMANKNPDNILPDGRREIASHYYPEDGPYGSSDGAVIERQLLQMKYAGIDGILLDWPGTVNAWDYPKNLRNSEAIINNLERHGLEFAIVHEDHNIGMSFDAGFIGDKLQAGRNDMTYLQNNYFGRPNYIRLDGRPLLLVFGPQTFQSAGEWDNVFSVLNPRPTFMTLWYESNEAAGNVHGEYAWIYNDFLTGLNHFYQFHQTPGHKIASVYPGFRTFYIEGGWPGPSWGINVGPETFRQTLNLAVSANIPFIQLNTWNDWGEGTNIEPSREFGNQFLTILQQTLGVPYAEREFDLIHDLYLKRVAYEPFSTIQKLLDNAADALAQLNPDLAADILGQIRLH